MEKEFDFKKIISDIITNPAPASCKEIEELLLNLPPRNSLIRQIPTKEQILAFELLNEKYNNSTFYTDYYALVYSCTRAFWIV